MLLWPLRSYSPPEMASDFPISDTFPPHPAPSFFSTTAAGKRGAAGYSYLANSLKKQFNTATFLPDIRKRFGRASL